jgi:hypothetical protein
MNTHARHAAQILAKYSGTTKLLTEVKLEEKLGAEFYNPADKPTIIEVS